MKRFPALTSLATVAVLGLAGCGGGEDPLATEPEEEQTTTASLVVGSANFPESVLLAEIYAGALEGAGLSAETRPNIGSREAYIAGLQDGSIDAIPEYTGNLRLYFDKDATASDSEGVYEELQAALPEELTVLEYAEAQDKDAVVVSQETADGYSLTAIGDLSPVAGELTLGGPPEWKTRQTGVPGLKAKYDVVFGDFVELDAGGPLTLNALLEGRIDAGNLFSTDPNVVAEGLVVLEDPESLFAAQNIVPLLRSEVVTDEVETALNEVSAELDTDTLAAMVSRVVIDKEDAQDVAAEFLADKGLD
jgi:osmoprotectant transport system substrate-binding protein